MSAASRQWPLGPIIIGVGGFCVLIALGIWQFSKVQAKNAIIGQAEQRLIAEPTHLPDILNPQRDDYRRVAVEGRFVNDEESYFLTSLPPYGPGFNVIAPFETTDGRRILVDRGFVPQRLRDPAQREATTPDGVVDVVGVLRWPQDTSFWTLDADLSKREFYSRSIEPLADFMKTEPLMILEGEKSGADWPRGSAAQVNIRNQHLPYAIQWFAIAAVWALMSFFWIRKVARPDPAQ